MAKVNPRKISDHDRMQYLDLLWTSIAELKSRQEVKNFFKDLLSEGESIMLARRIMIAKYLLEDKSYDKISELIGAGKATIAAVHNWLVSGFKGYENAVKKFNVAINKRLPAAREKPSMPHSFSWLRKKYPLHFLLFNILDKK